MSASGQSARATHDRIHQIWDDPLDSPAGLLHVCAVARRGDGTLGIMRIRPETPVSPADQFSLEVARARADIILTSGSILRSEPGLHHAIGEAASGWRQEILKKRVLPEIIFLSRGKDLPLTHPALNQPNATVATGPEISEEFRRKLKDRGIRHRWIPGNSPRELVRELLKGPAETITMELGPYTASQFYTGPTRVNELMLSCCEHFELPGELDAGDFISTEQLLGVFGPPCHQTLVEEAHGIWQFSRWVAAR